VLAWGAINASDFDPGNPQLVAYEESMNSILDGLGDKLCSHH
jgi:hypothetical protein